MIWLVSCRLFLFLSCFRLLVPALSWPGPNWTSTFRVISHATQISAVRAICWIWACLPPPLCLVCVYSWLDLLCNDISPGSVDLRMVYAILYFMVLLIINRRCLVLQRGLGFLWSRCCDCIDLSGGGGGCICHSWCVCWIRLSKTVKAATTLWNFCPL